MAGLSSKTWQNTGVSLAGLSVLHPLFFGFIRDGWWRGGICFLER